MATTPKRRSRATTAGRTGTGRRPAGTSRSKGTRPRTLLVLENDHRNFDRLLKLFERQLELFHLAQKPDYGLMRDIMCYMTQYPDRFHHPKEDLIFEHLQRIDPESRMPVQRMLQEHERIVARGSELLAVLEKVLDDALLSRESVETVARDYLTQMRAHMNLEQADLFPRAARRLTARDWAEIEAESERYDDPLFGRTVEPGYRAIFARLSGRAAAGTRPPPPA